MAKKFAAPAPTYLGPVAHSSGTNNKPINRIVIHCTVSTCAVGARGIAAYFQKQSAGGSAHYITSATETIQAAYDSVVAWHAPPNQHSLGVEMCCTLADKGKGHWERADHIAMMERTAELVAGLCLAYDVPIAKLTPADLKAGKRGICGHVDVSDAFGQSSHWDPGPFFPWGRFMGMVRAAAADLKNTPKPAPARVVKRKAEVRTVDTVVTFANIPSTATRDQIQRGFDVASKGSDVLITVEDHMRRSADFLGPEWLTFQGPGHQKGRCSVHLLDARFDVRGSSNPLLNRANGMTFPGATRYGQVVRSQDKRSGRLFNWGGFHLVPHADKDSQPGVLTDMPRGKANVLPAIASMILALPASLVGQEVWGADVNVDLDEDLRIRDLGMVEKFNAAGFVSDVQVLGPVPDTHGRDEYDWLMGRLSTPAVRWVAHETLPKLPGLDHRFRRATIRSTVRKGFPG